VTITGKSITMDGVETGGVNNVTLNGQITVAGMLNGAFAITDLNINATVARPTASWSRPRRPHLPAR